MKATKIVPWVFGLIGLGMLVGACLLFLNTRAFVAGASTAQGQVVDLLRSRSSDSETYKPVVTFTTADGRQVEFTSSMGSNPPAFRRGEQVTVLYHPQAPEEARIGSFFSLWGLELILGGMGAFFALIGWGILVYQWRRRALGRHLRQHGMPVRATVQSVALDTSYKVNGRSPYRIHAQWQDPGSRAVYVFSSDPIWYDPSKFVTDEMITVYIERGNPGRHHVDIRFLPPVGNT